MTNLISPATPFAGLYGPNAVLSTTGIPQPALPVTVTIQTSGSAATLYTDETKATPLGSNVVNTDSYGNLSFFADPGFYTLAFLLNGTNTTLSVEVSPWYPDAAWNVVGGITGGTTKMISGDSYYTSGSGTPDFTCPVPYPGSRVRLTQEGTGLATIGPNGSEVFLGPGCGVGLATLPLGHPGATITLEANADSNWQIVGGAFDSGWTDITSVTDCASFATARQIGDTTFLRGYFVASSTISPTAAFAEVPAQFNPPVNLNSFVSYLTSITGPGMFSVNSSGQLVSDMTVSSADVIAVDSWFWVMD